MQMQALIKNIPNSMTTAGFCAGLTGIYFILNNQYKHAVLAVFTAGVIDTFDGALARLLKTRSDVGMQLDSLSDLVCFGVVPALTMYAWTTSRAGLLGWAVLLVYCSCAIWRLSAFNVHSSRVDPSATEHGFFFGIPSPAAAGLLFLPLVCTIETGQNIFRNPYFNISVHVLVSCLMISRIPTLSFKRAAANRKFRYLCSLLVLVFIVISIVHSIWAAFIMLGIVYITSIPFGIIIAGRENRTAVLSVTGERDEEE